MTDGWTQLPIPPDGESWLPELDEVDFEIRTVQGGSWILLTDYCDQHDISIREWYRRAYGKYLPHTQDTEEDQGYEDSNAVIQEWFRKKCGRWLPMTKDKDQEEDQDRDQTDSTEA